MADLRTKYMGVELDNPLVVGACSLSKKVDTIKDIEASGAGALVIKTLFQEQIELERQKFEEALAIGENRYAESLRDYPRLAHAGPKEHLMWVEIARKNVKLPLFASINAKSVANWAQYARQLEGAGVNGLELNFYSVETDPAVNGAEIEKRLCETVAAVKAKVKIPVAVKLGPFYTSVANVAKSVVEAGADGLTLFNRFYQPEIDPELESLKISLDFSSPVETRLPLRWIAILSGELKADLAASTGVHTGADVARHLLAGAKVAQVVSALYLHGVQWIGRMKAELAAWMDAKGYARIEDFRGKVSRVRVSDPYAFERAQYIKLLLGQD